MVMDVAEVPNGNVTGNGDVDFFILPDVIADLYHATITGIEDQLVDYFVEITDVHGNVHKSDIQHVYVGSCNGCAIEGGGCIDVSANNYDPDATADDGSCVYSLTVQVDMSEVGNVSPSGVHIAGEFQGWNPGATALQDGGNGIWSAVIEVPSGSFECKFINGNAWGNEESVPASCGADDGVGGYNRVVEWDTSEASTLPPVCFGECAPCSNDPDEGGTDAESTLTIQVNMEGIDVASSGVHIAGTWQGWDAGNTPCHKWGNRRFGLSAQHSIKEPTCVTNSSMATRGAKMKMCLETVPTASIVFTAWATRMKCLTRCAMERAMHAPVPNRFSIVWVT